MRHNSLIDSCTSSPPYFRYALFCLLSRIIGQKYPWLEKKRGEYRLRIKESRYIR
ncbi:hypothetical protein [Aneurinibacillus migulanus]|uniref:Uncharacterized protein n=1 Tax=Aneurinibacillus migulanus TaxID=47500 RepID=A0A1G8U0Y3_ANEMI|nr:hypothetical protein [Aneurinibacillus migulanus]MED0893492.1 hypothetical protein [Aneurinibacillus migulanus]MED1616406.1 hypothetical protein [Aneurinibacillus migulanus]MED4729919.1 hypothetical protein [Aneurinibacillus migulanus]SDJ47421.1 hypothetical protein SAMN04487909_118101 [Aneurinibacillus migulanus]GED17534.1 hypothetical protein AMI01nite_55250 [Aneurinibacillus migulanus]